MEKRTAIVVGATGLIGSALVQLLLKDDRFHRVRILGRRSAGIQHEKLEEHIINFDQPQEWKHLVTGDVLFSALGTTLKEAGSREAQYKVDYTYQYQVAKAGEQNKVASYVVVSSAFANPKSRIFYTRMKGKLEHDIKALMYLCIHILQPSIIVAGRKEQRKGEERAIRFIRFLNGLGMALKYRPVDPVTVAQGMINVSFGLEIINVMALSDVFIVAQKDYRSTAMMDKISTGRKGIWI